MLTVAAAHRASALGLVKYPPNTGGPGMPCYTDLAPKAGGPFIVIYDRAGYPSADLSGYETPELQFIGRASVDGGPREIKPLLERIRRAFCRPYADYDLPQVWAPDVPDDRVTVTSCDANEPRPVPLGADQIGRPGWSITIQLFVPTMEAAP